MSDMPRALSAETAPRYNELHVARNSSAIGARDQRSVARCRGRHVRASSSACPALTKGDTRLVFNYQTRSAKITRLCDTDGFTLERQTSRIGCSLGKFIPITAEEAAALTAQPVAAPVASSSAND